MKTAKKVALQTFLEFSEEYEKAGWEVVGYSEYMWNGVPRFVELARNDPT